MGEKTRGRHHARVSMTCHGGGGRVGSYLTVVLLHLGTGNLLGLGLFWGERNGGWGRGVMMEWVGVWLLIVGELAISFAACKNDRLSP